MENFDQFVEAVKTQMQPEPRAKATASILAQLVKLVPEGTTLADLAWGWHLLSFPQSDSAQYWFGAKKDPTIDARRMICKQLSQLVKGFVVDADTQRTIMAWQSWSDAFDTNSTDSRHASMGKTFARELKELRSISSDETDHQRKVQRLVLQLNNVDLYDDSYERKQSIRLQIEYELHSLGYKAKRSEGGMYEAEAVRVDTDE